MSRFYVPEESVKGDQISIGGREAHHILDVMRLKISDEVVVFDGKGKEYAGKVTQIGRKSLVLHVVKVRDISQEKKYSITLIQAIPKKNKMDYIVEKATELGVDTIIPVVTARTIPDWDETKRSDVVLRWQKISKEASKQCGRVTLPQVKPLSGLEEAIKNSNGYALKLMAALAGETVKLKNALKGCPEGMIAVAIGPEGDFTPEEIRMAAKSGFKTVDLGPRVLKSDTAALAVLAIIDHECRG